MSTTSPQKDPASKQNPNERQQSRCSKDLKITPNECPENAIEISSVKITPNECPENAIKISSTEINYPFFEKSSVEELKLPNQRYFCKFHN